MVGNLDSGYIAKLVCLQVLSALQVLSTLAILFEQVFLQEDNMFALQIIPIAKVQNVGSRTAADST